MTGVAERAGDWIQTASGKRFWPLDPRAEDVCLADIARALAQKARWGGHASRLYSVAEHSLRVGWLAAKIAPAFGQAQHLSPSYLRLRGYLHDGHEAYLPDVPRPVKPFFRAMIGRDPPKLVDWSVLEEQVDAAIFGHFKLPVEDPAAEIVKHADNALLWMEVNSLFTLFDRSGLPEMRPELAWVLESGVPSEWWTRSCEAVEERFIEEVERALDDVRRGW